jgi:tRNA1Val (adenine37-N6)-methyltransferase
MSFRFKEFSIIDGNTPMKVGVDAVLLGSWIDVSDNINILDVGSGSGIIALMLAQRFPKSLITALEINKTSYKDLNENIINSPWQNRIKALNIDFNNWSCDNKYDLIISNPPFFEVANNMNDGRRIARQSASLSPSQLCNTSKGLLNPNSSLVVIYPFIQRGEFMKAAFQNGFYIFKELRIKDNAASEFKRSILFFKNINVQSFEQKELILKNEEGGFSKDFTELTKHFYLS